jgi:protein ImuB
MNTMPIPASDGADARLKSRATAAPGALYACLRSTRTPGALLPVARDFSPRIQRYGASCTVLDVSGLERLLGDPQAIAAELHRAAGERSKHISVAVAPTQTAALLLAFATADGATSVVSAGASATAGALARLPMTVLRQMVEGAYGGMFTHDGRAFDVLRVWGLTTIGEFASLPAPGLSERMGQSGLALQRIACGLDPAPLVPDPGVPRFMQSIELEWPIEQLEALSFVLARLFEPLSTSLERADRGAAAIRVDLRLTDRTTHARLLQLPAAMRDPRVLRTLVLLDLESHPPAAAIDIVTIEVDPAPSRIIQYSLLERARPSAETVATLTARLNALVGESRSGSPIVLDTHRPDGFEMRPLGTLNFFAGGHPEKVECPHFLLRRFRPPIAIRVAVDRGRPVSVAIDRRGMPGGRVEHAAGPWRTSGAWWDGAGAHWDRDEWDVAFADGALCRLFHDRVTEKWFLEGVID